MTGHIRLGMLTPSSNTVLEPVSSAIAASMANVSVHFARFRVTEIALDPSALQQFRQDPMLEAAMLLADAKVDAIAWNGTSGSWLGFDVDRSLCAAITERTGIPASTATLAIDTVFRVTSVEQFGLVTPYITSVQDQIIRTYAGEGYTCVAERHFGLRDNFSFATTPPDDRRGDPRSGGEQATSDRRPLHKPGGRGPCRRAGSGDRHSGLRLRRDLHLGSSAGKRRDAPRCKWLGTGFQGASFSVRGA